MMDNYGGHELDCTLPVVRIELLPPLCTAKYQPLDLGSISHSRMRYRSVLLRTTIEMKLKRSAGGALFGTSFNRGVRGIEEGWLPHVGYTIRIFEEGWAQTTRSTVIRC